MLALFSGEDNALGAGTPRLEPRSAPTSTFTSRRRPGVR
ncbi:Hypothetical protein CAP_5506 [Chondromyces apiculatus DSM 436]|uniref:Uncharacterized protein n=1 Tax=Chondromyces apiculatus DSM 436 TaxID=1192034 RepID=A0A017T3G8_9BACT|nr:Hypothetical protein CAP_5506 [Chondromyces apiculatus DSM 436]